MSSITKDSFVKVKSVDHGNSTIDLNQLSAQYDQLYPDIAPELLAVHAEILAERARKNAEKLAQVKFPAEEAASRLESFAVLLRNQETRWLTIRSERASSTLKQARANALEVKKDLFAALRYFAAERSSVQEALDHIAEGTGDADLAQDLIFLAALAEENQALIHETDLPPNIADMARTCQAELSRALTIKDATSEAAEVLAQRNRVFWHLAMLCRKTSAAGNYAFRRDPKQAALFLSYTSQRRKRQTSKGTHNEESPHVQSPSAEN